MRAPGSMVARRSWRTSRLSRLSSLLVASIFASLTPGLRADSPQQPTQPTPAATNSASHYLKVTINPSTSNIVEGAVYGLDAELENISNQPITIEVEKIQLAVQPELAPPDVSCTWLYDAGTNTKLPSPVVMPPGDNFTVFFDTGSDADPAALNKDPACRATFWSRLRRKLDFVPGNFVFVLTGTLVTATPVATSSIPNQSPTASNPNLEAPIKYETHYFTEKASLPITIDQFQIILYAAIGGFLAFLVMSLRSAGTLAEYANQVQTTSTKARTKILIVARQAGAAILVSVTVTVIASRLSTTSFPVKVSVEDFWGALTIGFVSYFIGGKFIDKLAELAPGTVQPPAPAPPAPAPPAPAPPSFDR